MGAAVAASGVLVSACGGITINVIKGGLFMGEKLYTTMKSVGAFNVIMGILLIVSGIVTGVMVITKGARLLRDKTEILF